MTYLSKEEILQIHSHVIDETGGIHGVRDHHAILSIEITPKQRVFGKELYSSLFSKAAVYARDITMNHPFIDGNKRTGMTAAFVFLEYNGYVSTAKEGEIQTFSLSIIEDKLSIKKITDWFRGHSKRAGKGSSSRV